MSAELRMLAEFISANGYDVWVQATAAGSVLGIFHAQTNREAVYGFDAQTQAVVFRKIAMQYCTEEQLEVLEAEKAWGDTQQACAIFPTPTASVALGRGAS